MLHRRLFLSFVFFAVAAAAGTAAAQQPLPLLTQGDVSGWEKQVFDDIPPTTYTAVQLEDGRRVLDALAEGSASGFTQRRQIALAETPWLHFRWRVLHADANPQEKTRAGDDFAWRLYFVGKSGLTHYALNLVYARHAAEGESWESPYAGFLREIRLHAAAAHRTSADAAPGEWRTTTLHLGRLWQEAFGGEVQIGLIGLMTDADNSGARMHTQYDVLVLSAEADADAALAQFQVAQ